MNEAVKAIIGIAVMLCVIVSLLAFSFKYAGEALGRIHEDGGFKSVVEELWYGKDAP